VPSEIIRSEFYRLERSDGLSRNKEWILIKNMIRKEVKINPEMHIYSVLYLYHKMLLMGSRSVDNEIVKFINENKNGFILQLLK